MIISHETSRLRRVKSCSELLIGKSTLHCAQCTRRDGHRPTWQGSFRDPEAAFPSRRNPDT